MQGAYNKRDNTAISITVDDVNGDPISLQEVISDVANQALACLSNGTPGIIMNKLLPLASEVIYEMINSEEDIKALNAEVVQIIVEDCSEGKILVGMTTNVNDVINVGYKFKIIKHILKTMGF